MFVAGLQCSWKRNSDRHHAKRQKKKTWSGKIVCMCTPASRKKLTCGWDKGRTEWTCYLSWSTLLFLIRYVSPWKRSYTLNLTVFRLRETSHSALTSDVLDWFIFSARQLILNILWHDAWKPEQMSQIRRSLLANHSVNRFPRQQINKQQLRYCWALKIETVFSVASASRLYNEDPRPVGIIIEGVCWDGSWMIEKRWRKSN
jgi:hypothetical protein